MIDAICDICGRQTCEPYELRCEKIYQDSGLLLSPFRESPIDKVICKNCANIIKNDIELRALMYKEKQFSWSEISAREHAKNGDETE